MPGLSRRSLFLGLGALLPATFIGTSAHAQVQAPLQLRMGSVVPEGIISDSQKKFVRLVGERTNGAVKIEYFCCSQLGGERQIADGIRLGTVDMALIGAAGSPTLNLMFTPFLFRNDDHALAVVNGPIGKKWAADFNKETGMRLEGWLLNTPRQFFTTRRAIRRPEDLKGLKLRAPEIPVLVAGLKALGATPVVIAFPEVYLALQQGLADGWESPINTFYDSKDWEVGKPGYITRVNWVTNMLYLAVNDGVWQKMTPPTQKVIQDTWREIATEVHTRLVEAEKGMIGDFKAKGVETLDVDPAPFLKAAGNFAKPFTDKTWGPGVYEAIQAVK